MKKKKKLFLLDLFLLTATFYFIFHGLSMAKGVLAPFFLAAILAMMLAPVGCYLEKKGLNRAWASFLSAILFLLLISAIGAAVGFEVKKVSGQWSDIQNRMYSRLGKLESYIEQNSGISIESPFLQSPRQKERPAGESAPPPAVQDQPQSNNFVIGIKDLPLRSWLSTSITKIFNFLATILLMLVYIFFMLMYRTKFKEAVLKFIPDEERNKGNKVLSEITKNAQHYLFGRMIVILVDAALYAVGFYISGMNSPFTTAVLAAVLTIVPYIGNFVGGIIAMGLAFITTGSVSAVWIVLATMTFTQVVESYLIAPYVVGKQININPLFTIFTVIIGAAVWGIIGMIVFLPLFSFLKSVADHVPMLHPLGYAIGNEDAAEGGGAGTKFLKKSRNWFKRNKTN